MMPNESSKLNTPQSQHIEICTDNDYRKISKKPNEIENLLFSSKFGDETYLKWPDKVVLKITNTPIITKFLTAKNSKITIS